MWINLNGKITTVYVIKSKRQDHCMITICMIKLCILFKSSYHLHYVETYYLDIILFNFSINVCK